MNYLGFQPSLQSPYYFVSYNTEDAARVAPIVTSLNSSGVSLWYDYGIPYDNKWNETITKRIFNSDAVLLFYTNGIIEKDDPYVITEYEIARLYQKTIYVILLDEINAAMAPFSKVSWLIELQKRQMINVPQTRTEIICREILRSLDTQNYSCAGNVSQQSISKDLDFISHVWSDSEINAWLDD